MTPGDAAPEDAGGFAEFNPAPRNHNQPPPGLREAGPGLELHLATMHAAIFKRAADLIAAEARVPAVIGTAEEDEKATAFVKQIQACEKELDALRTGEKAAYDQAGSQVHSTFRTVQDKLVRPGRSSPPSLKERVELKQTAYKQAVLAAEQKRRDDEAARLRKIEAEALAKREAEEAAARAEEDARRKAAKEAADKAQAEADEALAIARRKRNADALAAAQADAKEKQRLADEAAANRRAEEDQAAADRRVRADAARAEADAAAEVRAQAEKEASAPAATMTRARGKHGGISSLRTFWDFRDLERAGLDLEALREHLPTDALESAVRSFVKAGGRKLAGVVIFENTGTVTR